MINKLKTLIFGQARNVSDRSVFHRLSLIAFFAWVGLGADGLSSSCYGPPEGFLELGKHTHLAIFVALGTAITVLVISASYSQIIELFPSGGGGYVVASKLLSPRAGMISGCALLIDYVLTIAVSIASGAQAIFSFLPADWHQYRILLALGGVALLTVMNLRGVRESVIPLVPIFVVFLLTHAFAIIYVIAIKSSDLPWHAEQVINEVRKTSLDPNVGTLGMILLILRSYSMGAGTFTGIEAVSNGMIMLREPRVKTAKTTMRYMAWSLAFTAMGLMIAYIFYGFQRGDLGNKTLNALLFEKITEGWNGSAGWSFVLITLISEAAILFVAAQTGFLGGPRVLANMALDRWFPGRFTMLSDRLVTQNGIVLMGVAAMVIMVVAHFSSVGGAAAPPPETQPASMAATSTFPIAADSDSARISATAVSKAAMAQPASGAATGRSDTLPPAKSAAETGSGDEVKFLVILYAINVFITFCLSQLGMVRHWWSERHGSQSWRRPLMINGLGLVLCTFILASTVVLKFHEGGWKTLLITGALVALALWVRRHYNRVHKLLSRLDSLTKTAEAHAAEHPLPPDAQPPQYDPKAKTAVLLVGGFNGVGLHSLLNTMRFFGETFRNFVFVQVGVIDAGNFKGTEEVTRLKLHTKQELEKYVEFCRRNGYFAESYYSVGVDVIDEIDKLSPIILQKYPSAVFFGGQLVFPQDTVFSRWLHNAVVFAVQRRFYNQGVPFVILPIRVTADMAL